MNNAAHPNDNDQDPAETERFPAAQADRPPSAAESEAAERAAEDVDLDAVAEHFEEMTELGKNVEGEGEIVPN